MQKNKILVEGTNIHRGTFVDADTFLDQNGQPYDLQMSDFGKGEKSSGGGAGGEEGGESGNANSSGGGSSGNSSGSGNEAGEDSQESGGGQQGNGGNSSQQSGGDDGDAGEASNQGSQGGQPQEHHGSYENENTFNDENGDPYDLERSELPDNQKRKPPELKTPEKGQMFKDVRTGKKYKWDGKKFVLQRL